MKKLPIGIQDFNLLRAEDYLYVDKTRYIYDLLSQGKGLSYFLARPRRFGKSLLISTFKELFMGNKDLFNGLWIYDSPYIWQTHPVIHLDFSSISSQTSQEFKASLVWKLTEIGKYYGVDISDAPTLESKLEYLVLQLAEKTKVVFLIDEYDKPLLAHVNNLANMREIQTLLSSFYSTLKSVTNKIHFLFMTGITKFSKTSVFSGMNNLIDLTFLQSASKLLGYTEDELYEYFYAYIQRIAQEQQCSIEAIKSDMRYWYNGYAFSENAHTVYNPFSILMYLFSKKLHNYWFETGTPSFLIKLIQEKNYAVEGFEFAEVNTRTLDTFEVEDMQLAPLLLQTGYLTIKGYNPSTQNYQLGYPNEETKLAFLAYFMRKFTQAKPEQIDTTVVLVGQAIKDGDLVMFFERLKVFFASIPYDIQISREQYYQSIFYVVLSLLGAYVSVEVRTNHGRIDATIITDTHAYLFEFKLDGSDVEALGQITQKRYYEKFIHGQKKICLVGVNFDTRERNIQSWTAEDFLLSKL